MAIGTVTKYNKMQSNLMKAAGRQWDDGAAGNVMFLLVSAAYTPNLADATVAALGANYISAGDGAPIAATTMSIDDTTTPDSVYLACDAADFGTTVTITAKYLVAVQPVTPNTLASTAKLLWYVDLDTQSGAAEVSSTDAVFKINQPANGWVKM